MKKCLLCLWCSLSAFGGVEAIASDGVISTELINETVVDNGSRFHFYTGVGVGYRHVSDRIFSENVSRHISAGLLAMVPYLPGSLLIHSGQEIAKHDKSTAVASVLLGVNFRCTEYFSIAPELLLDASKKTDTEFDRVIDINGLGIPGVIGNDFRYKGKITRKAFEPSFRICFVWKICPISAKAYIGPLLRVVKGDCDIFTGNLGNIKENHGYSATQFGMVMGFEKDINPKVSVRLEGEYDWRVNKSFDFSVNGNVGPGTLSWTHSVDANLKSYEIRALAVYKF